MLVRRLVALVALVTLLAAGVSLGSPGAIAVAGAGSSTTSARVLDIEVGKSVLGVRLLGDEGRATIDPALGPPEALARLTPLAVTSPVASLSKSLTRESRSSRGAKSERSPAAALPTPPAVASGRLDAGTQSATVDGQGARASMEAAAHDIALVGGLVSAGRLSSALESRATGSGSASDRSVEAGPVTVLRLSALLQGLGIGVSDLPLEVVDALLTRLALPVDGVPSGTSLNAQLGSVKQGVAAIEAVLAGLGGQVSAKVGLDPVTPIVQPVTPIVQPVTPIVQPVTPIVQPVTPTVPDPGSALPVAPGGSDPVDKVLPPLTGVVPPPITTVTDGILRSAPQLVSEGSKLLPEPIQKVLTNTDIAALKQQLDALLVSLKLPPISPTTTVADLVALVDRLRAAVPDLLGKALRSLDAAALLTVDGARVVVSTAAADTLDASGPNVDARVGAVRIGALDPLPGVDLSSGPAAVDRLATLVNAAIGRILGTIDPGLAGIVEVDLLDIDQGKSAQAGANRAFVSVTAVRASVTPPSMEKLSALVSKLAGRTGVEDLLAAAGATVPDVGAVMGELGAALRPALALQAASSSRPGRVRAASAHEVTGALVQGVSVTLGQVTSESIFRPGVAPAVPGASGGALPDGSTVSVPGTGSGSGSGTGGFGTGSDVPGSGSGRTLTGTGESGGTLPVTGGRATELAAVALLLVALGIGLPHWERALSARRPGG